MVRRHLVTVTVMVLALMAGTISQASANPGQRSDRETVNSSPLIRGGIVYKSYCLLCHGDRGDGVARATRLYGQMNLVLSLHDHPRPYYEKMIRDGGSAVGRSKLMPTWRDELTNEQIDDVMNYVDVIDNPVMRGEVVFKTNCILCHGIKGDGKGRAAVLFNPPPADLTHSDKNDQYKTMIITMGGKAMGRSDVMPVWDGQLSQQEIADVVAYLRTIVADRN